jgi:hypothetical protein
MTGAPPRGREERLRDTRAKPPTRDVVVDGTAKPVDIADLSPQTGDALANKTGLDPRELEQGTVVEPVGGRAFRRRRRAKATRTGHGRRLPG